MQEPGRILILGAGPMGLGAALRLEELGYKDYLVVERLGHPGGLATSYQDEHGYTWDIGGHVQFSHYEYFDKVMDQALGDDWLYHERESWVWMCDTFVPYPFQYNIRYLPEKERDECLRGVLELFANEKPEGRPAHFGEWIERGFGSGIAKYFMNPYNFKVWATPPAKMDFQWIGERVAQLDLERTVFNVLHQVEDVSWGPNNTFRFPKHGGTGSIWRSVAKRIPEDKIQYQRKVAKLSTESKTVSFEDGSTESYDWLLSSVPLDTLVGFSDLEGLKPTAEKLRYSSVHIFGLALKGSPPEKLAKKCWMYFPESNCPFFRVTVFSNYSPNNVPEIANSWSLMAEVSESEDKPVDREALEEEVIQGALNAKLIESRDQIHHVWKFSAGHGYPTPFLGRDKVLDELLPALEAKQVLSRGRFGAWKYEVSNQDHTMMQGVEAVDRLLRGEEELTVNRPDVVNKVKRKA